ncbi:mucoidy inhibitor-like protein [Colletotrichum musicola]|uniref:Mucoidy inhibitor-like protein n=1 Tax=Colletotrichum musicola TaxID=2175873 RepID=A0A8H6NUY6_9PEZI|nr:mucoidy inhibitor-like protein [Colletotrichum musicola]
MESLYKKQYHVRDLTTRSVTLFPNRAQVVRDLKDLQLKPGTNEVTILGLTPTVDESTIKVEGTGSAVISDITIELLPNRDIFQDIYPDEDDDDEDPMDVDSDNDDTDLADSPELEAARTLLSELRDEERRAKEIVESAASRLKILDAYGKSLDRKKNLDITEGVDKYRAEREKVFSDHMAGIVRGRENSKHLAAAIKEEARLAKLKEREVKRLAREEKNAAKASEKQKQKDARREAERLKEKARVRKERERFWPKVCYSVRVTLEAYTFTPSSSRRTSISSDTARPFSPIPEADGVAGASSGLGCDLSLSYVTSSASWAPSYDLQMSTTTNTATLCYDARITNETSETWSNCKVTLSTSQTTFSGLQNQIPTLKPWNIKLASKNSGLTENSILDSREERQHRGEWWSVQQAAQVPQRHRPSLFGVEEAPPGGTAQMVQMALMQQQMQQMQQRQQRQQMQQPMVMQQPMPQMPPVPPTALARGERLDSTSETSQALATALLQRRSAVNAAKPRSSMASVAGSVAESAMSFIKPAAAKESYEGSSPDLFGAVDEESETAAALDFEESTFEETGFTTTYDLPGVKTLPPRPTASKQRVARVSFSNVSFSHTVVAKYKPVAYLKAKVRNTSRLTLLRGAAGLTLDGTFMGRTTLPRCSAGDCFSLGLGADPAVAVNYPKVDVRRATTGFFSKENSAVYARSVTVANSRAAAGKPVSLLVLDQVPVSEDERLKVDVLQPAGLVVDGAGKAVGRPGRGEKEDADWGTATATLRKGGQVEWLVSLNAGKAVKLGLEYVVAMPSGDAAVEC